MIMKKTFDLENLARKLFFFFLRLCKSFWNQIVFEELKNILEQVVVIVIAVVCEDYVN